MAISFSNFLVLLTIGTFALLLLAFLRRPKRGGPQEEGPASKLGLNTSLLLILLALLVFYLTTPVTTEARYLFFLVEFVFMAGLAVIALRSPDTRIATIGIAAVIGVTAANDLATKLFLGGTVWGLDERGYMLNALGIGATSSLLPAQVGYYQIPVVPQVLYALSSVTSLPISVTDVLVSLVMVVLFQASIYVVCMFLLPERKVALLVQMVSIYIPRLAITQEVIPEGLSIVLAILILVTLLKVFFSDSASPRKGLALALVMYSAMVLTHPSGVLVLVPLLMLVSVAYYLRVGIRGLGVPLGFARAPGRVLRLNTIVLLLAICAAAYWILFPAITDKLLEVVRPFFSAAAIRLSIVSSYYVPLYTQAGLQYALMWALPVAVSASYYASALIIRRPAWQTIDSLGLLSFIAGGGLVVLSFFILASSPTSGADRYLGSPGYLVLLLSLVPALKFALSGSRSNLALVSVLIFLFAFLAIGPTVPDIAPDAHPIIFEPITASSIQFYANSLSFYPPGSITATGENFGTPVPLSQAIARSNTTSIDPSYKVVRDIFGQIQYGAVSITSFPGVLFTIDGPLLPNFLTRVQNVSNIYLSSGDYMTLGTRPAG